MSSLPRPTPRLIALDLDGTLLGADGQVGARNLAAVQAAQAAGVEVAIATGRRHGYALKVLEGLGLDPAMLLVSSNGAVVRRLDGTLVERTLMAEHDARWLCGHLGEFRNALVITFDRVGADGLDERGTLVVEEMEDLHGSIGRWMQANEPYLAHVRPIEQALDGQAPIQMMLCGTVERMRRAERRMLEDPGVRAVGDTGADGRISLNRTEYPERDLSIVDILPVGCSKGNALGRMARRLGFGCAQMMAIGDNWNDLSMLEAAGWPVLMGNAPEDLSAMALERGWQRTGFHDADGVAEAIEAALGAGPACPEVAEEILKPVW